jgi:hypothetical protein
VISTGNKLMKVACLDISKYLSKISYNPSPHRFKSEEIPVYERDSTVRYSCNKCNYEIILKISDFKKHCNSKFSNINNSNISILNKIKIHYYTNKSSFLDFYCPICKQPTIIIFNGGPTGYWGAFGFTIKGVLVIQER